MPYNYNPTLQRDLSETSELINKIKKFQDGLSSKNYELYQELFININRFVSFVVPNFEKKLKDTLDTQSDDDLELDLKININDSDYDSVSEYEEDESDTILAEIPEQYEYLRNKYTDEQIENLKEKNYQNKCINNLFSNIENKINERERDVNYTVEQIFE